MWCLQLLCVVILTKNAYQFTMKYHNYTCDASFSTTILHQIIHAQGKTNATDVYLGLSYLL